MVMETDRRSRILVEQLNAAATTGDSEKLQRAKGDIMMHSLLPGAPKVIKDLSKALHEASGYHRNEGSAAKAALAKLNLV